MNSHVAEPFRSILNSFSGMEPTIQQMIENVRRNVASIEYCQGCFNISECRRYHVWELVFMNICGTCDTLPRFKRKKLVDANGLEITIKTDVSQALKILSDLNRELDKMFPQDDAA